MYTGKVVEEALVEDLFHEPLHPYTEGLMQSIPSLDGKQNKDTEKLREIQGIVPDLSRLPRGCPFSPRCIRVMDRCRREEPPFVEARPRHSVRCWLNG